LAVPVNAFFVSSDVGNDSLANGERPIIVCLKPTAGLAGTGGAAAPPGMVSGAGGIASTGALAGMAGSAARPRIVFAGASTGSSASALTPGIVRGAGGTGSKTPPFSADVWSSAGASEVPQTEQDPRSGTLAIPHLGQRGMAAPL